MRLVINLLVNGYNYRQIGEQLNCSRQNAHNLAVRYWQIREKQIVRLQAEKIWLEQQHRAIEHAINAIKTLIANGHL